VPVKNYSAIASIYSHLMHSIDYEKWAKYIFQIGKEIKKKNIFILELASGTGVIAKYLHSKINNIVSTDISFPMLKTNYDNTIQKVCCDMTALPFKNKFDYVFSTFDSINYLTTKNKFRLLFASVYKCLDKDGLFTFDVSLKNNSLKYEKYLNRQGRTQGITFQQKSNYNRRTRIHSNRFELMLANGKKVEEIHKQKIYRFEDYFDFVDSSDFYVYKCYKSFTFENADSSSERAQFILKKKSYA